ncbi:DUF6161 domain-containing protein [Vibrio parahaemolyticus]
MEHEEFYEIKGLFGISITFDSLTSLKSYVDNELEQFRFVQSNFYKRRLDIINAITGRLANLQSQIEMLITDKKIYNYAPGRNLHNLENAIKLLIDTWAPFEHPVFERLKSVFNEFGANSVEIFWINVIGGFKQPNNHEQMMGALNAYDFLYGRRSLSEISNSEFGFIEKNYSNALKKGHEVDEAIVAFSNLERECQHSWNDLRRSCDISWDSITEEKRTEWEKEKASFNTERFELLESATKKLCDLETAYQEHLKLEKPAKYWSDAAKKYSDAGAWWGAVLVLLILVGIAGFVHFYSKFLMGQELGVSLDTVKGVVLFVTGITVYGFLIRVVSRLLMSTIHLQRDSEERAQLTYFYLSLIKDGAIDEDSRNIVIQSLFSRTETGLITGDSSPTMPTVDVLKNIKLGS